MTDLEMALARRTEILTLLSTIPITGSVSEGGRSASFDRSALLAELRQMNEQIAILAAPFVITSTGVN